MTMQKVFKAMRIYEEQGKYIRKIETRSLQDLPEGEVLIRVKYSSLNYKDALSVAGNKGVSRNYPHTPGIDAAGIVEQSLNSDFQVGDEVIVTSYDLGMNTDGGFAEYIRVPASWVVPLPAKMSLKQSMIYGTAGFTAALSVYRLLAAGQQAQMGAVVVTGALGGVGSIAIRILSSLGFEVIAATSDDSSSFDSLEQLGASSRITREITDDQSGRLLLKPLWAGAVDVVGGNTLHTLLKACKPMGNVTCCGNIGSGDLPMTVYPFILNGISLIGIDSQKCQMDLRRIVWNKLATDWNVYLETEDYIETSLEELGAHIDLMLTKKSRGRIIVNLEK